MFSNFPAKSRKKLLTDYVKLQLLEVERLAGQAEVFDLGDRVFAFGKSSSVTMIRLPSKAALFNFLSAPKKADEAGLIANCGDDELVIRVNRDKPLAIRKAHGKLWQLSTHLKRSGHNDIEINSSWIYDCEVVQWDMDND